MQLILVKSCLQATSIEVDVLCSAVDGACMPTTVDDSASHHTTGSVG
jgi:hypothetical protein